MNALDTQLYWFSSGFAVVIGAMLVVPILRRKSDVFTAWNFFLLGAFVFTGMSGLNSATEQEYLPTLSRSSYHKFYLGTIVFYTSIFAVYHWFKAPRRLAGRTLLNWPELSSVTSPLIAIALMGLLAGLLVPSSIPFIGQVLHMFSLIAPSIAVAVLTIAWFRDRGNVVLLGLLLFVIPIAMAASIAGGGSRRYLISMLAAVPVSVYWVWLRYKSQTQIFVTIGLILAIAIQILAGFSAIRHSNLQDKTDAVSRAKLVVQALPNAIKKGGSSEGFMGQDSVECALSVIELLDSGSGIMEVDPLASLWLIATNAIPRSVWPEKPDSLGYHLVDRFGLKYTDANLGLNVVGQGYYDGGLLVLVLYALIMGSFLRFYDELLVRRPGNPLLVGGLVAMSSQILGWPRGCIGLMGMQIIQSFVLVMLTMGLSRLVLGTGIRYPRTDHLVNYPILRSAKDWQSWMGSYTAVLPGARRPEPMSD